MNPNIEIDEYICGHIWSQQKNLEEWISENKDAKEISEEF
ncbi:24789_t:CDS:2 [Gigaspora margarita]|uniref:24789_t:CDS:1 n=1 Tax=Gigaspora margarita TaxID=4874 RepID=A0ABM8VYR4_GIGMA|nr:24789_t:CDS:2 [Gigaspora margarita]